VQQNPKVLPAPDAAPLLLDTPRSASGSCAETIPIMTANQSKRKPSEAEAFLPSKRPAALGNGVNRGVVPPPSSYPVGIQPSGMGVRPSGIGVLPSGMETTPSLLGSLGRTTAPSMRTTDTAPPTRGLVPMINPKKGPEPNTDTTCSLQDSLLMALEGRSSTTRADTTATTSSAAKGAQAEGPSTLGRLASPFEARVCNGCHGLYITVCNGLYLVVCNAPRTLNLSKR
jgi:hypothetical protein